MAFTEQAGFEERIRSALQEAYVQYDQRLETALRAAAMSARAAEAAVEGGRGSSDSWARYLKGPEVWKPQNREEELTQWRDFKFQLVNWLSAMDTGFVEEIKAVSDGLDEEREISGMQEDTRNRAYKLFSVLCSLLRGRPLALIKQFEISRNGYESPRVLFKEMEPHQRMRSLALARELSNYSNFDKSKTLHEQLIAYEDLVVLQWSCLQ